jgi:hypothetical protein
MTRQATATFVIDRWDERVLLEEPGIRLVQTSIGKTFQGELEGTSVGEMIMAGAQQDSRSYVGFEQIVAKLHDRQGTFVLHHDASMHRHGGSATWLVMEDSGTGELAGIRGTAQIHRDADGKHTFTLDYDLGGRS